MSLPEELEALVKSMMGGKEEDIARVAKELAEHIQPALEKLISYIGNAERAILILDYKNVSTAPKGEGDFRLRGRITVVGAPDSKTLHDFLTPMLDSIMKDVEQEVLSNEPGCDNRERIEKEWREDDKEISVDDILKALPKFEAS